MEGKQDAGELYSILCIVSTQVGLQCVLYLDLVGFPIHLPYSAIFNGVPRCSMCIPHGRIKTWKGIFCIDLPHYQYICSSLKYNSFVCPSINYCPAQTNRTIYTYQVVPGTRRGGSFKKKDMSIGNILFIGIVGDLGRSEVKWTELKRNEMKWRNERMKCMKESMQNKSMEWKERMKEWMNAWMHE